MPRKSSPSWASQSNLVGRVTFESEIEKSDWDGLMSLLSNRFNRWTYRSYEDLRRA